MRDGIFSALICIAILMLLYKIVGAIDAHIRLANAMERISVVLGSEMI